MNTSERAQFPGNRSSGKRTVTISLSIPAFISSGLLLCVALVWVFILGIILGRGYTPESRIPELERIMPHGKPGQPPQVISAQDPPAAPKGTPQAAEDHGGNDVLTPDELEFRNSLKTGSAARGTAAAKPQPADKPAPAKPEEPAKPAPNTFDFVYQLGAHKDTASSDAQAAKLKKLGYKARTEKSVENGATWYRTLVSFRGTVEEALKMKKQMTAQKLPQPILRSRAPAR